MAVAYKLDPTITEKIKSITMMGGTFRGEGNVTLCTEYNFRSDPEATAIVFRAFKNIILVPWETCIDLEITKQSQIDKLYPALDTKLGEFNKKSNDHFLKLDGKYCIVDTLAAVCIIDESAIKSSFMGFGIIETTNSMSKGMIQFYRKGHS